MATGTATAQQVRVSGASSLRYIELRPLVPDSVIAADAPGAGLLRQLEDGRVVRCVPGEAFCRDVRPGSRASTVLQSHDVELSTWGFGRGVRGFAQARVRSAIGGGAELWPEGTSELELLAAYAELDRERLRIRAGRQWKVTGLGFYNFDGVAVGVRPVRELWLEAYTGRSLLRGLNESRVGGALASVDALAPTAAGLLLGVQTQYRPLPALSVGAVYQVDSRLDGRGLYSELLAGDGVLRLGGGSLEARLEFDAAAGLMNEARLRAHSAPIGRVALHAELRRYRPYFEQWTIWGAFSPVGFDEAQAGVTWANAAGRLLVRVDGSIRSYGGARAGAVDELRDNGWSIRTTVNWQPARDWRVDGSWRTETGVGAGRRDGHVGAARQFGDVATIALQALAFERLYEFRLSEGTVLGMGADATARLSPRVRVHAAAALYRHVRHTMPGSLDWNQRRAQVRVQWLLGTEPHGALR